MSTQPRAAEESNPEKEARRRALDRVFGSMPWLRPTEKQHFRVRVFKSGNSLALRLPAGLNLRAGMEMDLEVEDGVYTLEPVEQPKRKFNVGKVAGSATSLRPIEPEDRVFEDRPLPWPVRGGEPGADA